VSERGEDYRALNRAWWEERVPLHTASDFYDVDGFVAGRDSLQPLELEALGDVTGLDLVHLQCHFGMDTLSWWRHGARVAGLDFSGAAIAAATELAGRIDATDARFVEADVYDAVETLGADYDIVYQGVGSLTWHPDLDRFAGIVDALLRPGGRYFLLERHPVVELFDDAGERLEHGYFFDPAGQVWGEDGGSYADLDAVTQHDRTLEFRHHLSEVFGAFLGKGFALERFDEHPYTVFPMWPWLEEREGHTWWAPEGRQPPPMMFSVLFRKG